MPAWADWPFPIYLFFIYDSFFLYIDYDLGDESNVNDTIGEDDYYDQEEDRIGTTKEITRQEITKYR